MKEFLKFEGLLLVMILVGMSWAADSTYSREVVDYKILIPNSFAFTCTGDNLFDGKGTDGYIMTPYVSGSNNGFRLTPKTNNVGGYTLTANAGCWTDPDPVIEVPILPYPTLTVIVPPPRVLRTQTITIQVQLANCGTNGWTCNVIYTMGNNPTPFILGNNVTGNIQIPANYLDAGGYSYVAIMTITNAYYGQMSNQPFSFSALDPVTQVNVTGNPTCFENIMTIPMDYKLTYSGACGTLVDPNVVGTTSPTCSSDQTNYKLILNFAADGATTAFSMVTARFNPDLVGNDIVNCAKFPSTSISVSRPVLISSATQSLSLSCSNCDTSQPQIIAWSRVSGPAISFTPNTETSYTFAGADLSVGEYTVRATRRSSVSGSYTCTAEASFIRGYTLNNVVQTGNKFVFTADSTFNLGTTNCASLVSVDPDCATALGSALCQHTGGTDTLTIYAGFTHTLTAGSCMTLNQNYLSSSYTVTRALPGPASITLAPETSTQDIDMTVANTMAAALSNSAGLTLSYVWTQVSGPTLAKNTTEISQTWDANTLVMNEYKFRVVISIADSNNWAFTVDRIFQAVATMISFQDIGNKLHMVFSYDYTFVSCAQVLTPATVLLLGSSPFCEKPAAAEFDVYFSNDSTAVTESIIEVQIPYYEIAHPLVHPPTQLTIEGGGTYSTVGDLTLTGTPTDDVETTPPPVYVFTQTSGPQPLPNLNSSEAVQFIPEGSIISGTYTFHLTMQFPPAYRDYFKEADGELILSTTFGALRQAGSVLNVVMSWQFQLNGALENAPVDCAEIIAADSLTIVNSGAPPLCEHRGNKYIIYLTNSSEMTSGTVINLVDHPDFLASPETFTVHNDLPSVTISGEATYDELEDIVLTGVPLNILDTFPIYTWTQLSGPGMLVFTANELIQTFVPPNITAGEYKIQLKMGFPDSNGFELNANFTLNILTKLISPATQYINKFEFVFNWRFVLSDSLVNEPLACSEIFDPFYENQVNPIECTHNYDKLTFYVSGMADLTVGSVIHLKALSFFSGSINCTVSSGLPQVSIAGAGMRDQKSTVTLTATPTGVSGFFPIYFWAQLSGPEVIPLNETDTSQNVPPELFSAGDYYFKVQMEMPGFTKGYATVGTSLLVIKAKLFGDGDQYGNKFKWPLTFPLWLDGNKQNTPVDCDKILDATTLTLLNPTKCDHIYDLLTIYANNDSTVQGGDTLTSKTQGYLRPIAFSVPRDLPKIENITPTPEFPWDSEATGNTLTVNNLNGDGVILDYIWEVVVGNLIASFAETNTSAIEFVPGELAGGEYEIRVGMEVVGGNGYIVHDSITFQLKISKTIHFQVANLITVHTNGPYYIENALINNPACSSILDAASILKLGSTPLCSHDNYILDIFLSNDSSMGVDDTLVLVHDFFSGSPVTIAAIQPVPALTLVLESSPDNFHQLRSELTQIQGTLTRSEGIETTMTWTQIGTPPSKIYFDNNELLQMVTEKALKAGNFSVALNVLYPNSNDYNLNQVLPFQVASLPTVSIKGGKLTLNYNQQLSLNASCIDNDNTGDNSQLVWEWRISLENDFSVSITLVDGSTFNPATYANKNIMLPNRVLPEGHYYVELKASKWEYYSSTVTSYFDVFAEGPTIQLQSSNTKLKHNPLEDLCVTASAFSYDGFEIVITWPRVIPNVLGKIKTPSKLCLPAKELQPGTNYTIICMATEIPTRERRALALYVREVPLSIVVSKFPRAGEMAVTPLSGKGFTDEFTITVTNWFDVDSGGDLYYIIQTEVVGSITGYVSLNTYTTVSTIKTFLPPGDPVYNYLISVRVKAKNQYGAEIYKDVYVKVYEPGGIEDKMGYLEGSLLNQMENKTLSERLFRLSTATYFSTVPDKVDTTKKIDACGGCGENGACVVSLGKCKCNTGYDGVYCENTLEEIAEMTKVNVLILTNIATINADESYDDLFEGEEGDTMLSAVLGATKTQTVNNAVANTMAKALTTSILEFYKKPSTSDQEEEPAPMSKSTSEKILKITDNLFQGIGYQSSNAQIAKEEGTELETEEITIAVATEGEEETEQEITTQSVEEKLLNESLSVKGMVEDVGALSLAVLQIGEENSMDTNSYEWKGGKVSNSELKSKTLKSSSTTVVFPPLDMADDGESVKFQFLEWKFPLFTFHNETSSIINNIQTLDLYADKSIEPKKVENLTQPFELYFQIRQPSTRQYCAYYDKETKSFSNKGLEVVYTRFVNGIGLIICSTTHLSDFATLKNAPNEYMDTLGKTNYDTITKFDSFEDYDVLNSPIFWFGIIISVILVPFFVYGVYRDKKEEKLERQVQAERVVEEGSNAEVPADSCNRILSNEAKEVSIISDKKEKPPSTKSETEDLPNVTPFLTDRNNPQNFSDNLYIATEVKEEIINESVVSADERHSSIIPLNPITAGREEITPDRNTIQLNEVFLGEEEDIESGKVDTGMWAVMTKSHISEEDLEEEKKSEGKESEILEELKLKDNRMWTEAESKSEGIGERIFVVPWGDVDVIQDLDADFLAEKPVNLSAELGATPTPPVPISKKVPLTKANSSTDLTNIKAHPKLIKKGKTSASSRDLTHDLQTGDAKVENENVKKIHLTAEQKAEKKKIKSRHTFIIGYLPSLYVHYIYIYIYTLER